jgi:PAS domain S-box-containing protein
MARRIAMMHLYVLLGVVLAVPVATLGLWQRHVHRQERAAEIDRQLRSRAQDVGDEVALVLRLRAQEIEETARRASAAALPAAEGGRVVEGGGAGSGWLEIHLVSEVAALARPAGAAPVEPGVDALEVHRQRLRETRRPQISDGMVLQGQPAVAGVWVSAPVLAEGGVLRGLVSGAMRLDTLQAQLEENARRSETRVVLVDGDGAVLADSAGLLPALARYEAAPVGRAAAPSSAPAAIADGTEPGPDGRARPVRRVAAPVPAPAVGWQVVVSRSTSALSSGAAAISASTLWATAAAALFTIAVVLLVGQAMRRDLRQLVGVARGIGEGEFRKPKGAPSAILPREVGELWDAMHETLAVLDESDRTRKALFAELQRADEQARWLAAGLRDTQDGFLVLDRERRIVYVNPAWLRMRDLEGLQVLGRKATEVALGEGVPPPLLDSINDTLSEKRSWLGSVTSKRRDGSTRELELSISPVFNEKGETDHYVELARDVTERRAAEHAMMQSERLASLGMLAAGMAHEINNPMTYVLSNLEHLHELTSDGELTAAASAELDLKLCLEDSIHGARRVVEIVADLQALSRQRQDGSAGKASALQTLEACVRMAQLQLRHTAEVVRDFPVEDVWLSINPQKLGQVLLNLILNAAHAMSGGGAATNKLTLAVSSLPDGRGEIAVRDTGSGMTQEVAQRIFDPFFTTKGTGGGTGLGLSISHTIISTAKGEILVESEPGKGTCFRVRLPLAQTGEVEAASPAVALRGLSVLVVDDEPGVLAAIRRMLASCRTQAASSAAEALELIEREDFDLVLSDVMMAERSGVELVHALRERKPALAKRVCLMSAGVIGGELMREVKSIGVPLLHKPMTSQELHQTLSRVHRGEG